MDKPVRRLFLFFSLLFVALVLQLTYVQVIDAPKLKIEPTNTRAIEEEMQIERGKIYSADGVLLADNIKMGEDYERTYPKGTSTAPWLGYNSLIYGRAGIERVYNQDLTGQSGTLGVINQITGARQGADLELTIDMGVQAAAINALGERKGAVVALDPRTGAVIAMVSYPRYDPNRLEDIWADISVDEGRPLLNRATLGLYPPGSVFKIIVAAAALETGKVTADTEFDDTGTYTAGGYEVSNYDDKVYGKHDFAKAFASSINTTFAKLGVELGAEISVRLRQVIRFRAGTALAPGRRGRPFPRPGQYGCGSRRPSGFRARRSAGLALGDGSGHGRGGQRREDDEALHSRKGHQRQRHSHTNGRPGRLVATHLRCYRSHVEGSDAAGGQERHGNRRGSGRRPGCGQDGHRGSRRR